MAKQAKNPEISEWTSYEVRNWIRDKLALPVEAEYFFAHKIDGPTLITLTEEDVKSVIQMDGDAKEMETGRRLALRKLLGHIHILRLPYAPENDSTQRPRGRAARPPPKTERALISRAQSEIMTPRTSRGRNSGDLSARSVMSEISRSRMNLGVKYTEVDSCFGMQRASDSVIGSFNRAPLGKKESRPTPGPSSYFGEYGQAAKKSAAPATFSTAGRTPDFLFSKGQTSPGVCKYNLAGVEKRPIRGGSMNRASRWQSLNPQEITPGPSSYQPRHFSLSTFR